MLDPEFSTLFTDFALMLVIAVGVGLFAIRLKQPLIVLSIMGLMGFRRRTGFLSGLAVAQISEFSLILAALGMGLGHIGPDTVGLITLVALITIGCSTYLIMYSHWIYERINGLLKPFERSRPFRESQLQGDAPAQKVDVIVFGLGRYGNEIALGLHKGGKGVLAVDFDPLVIRRWREENILIKYGDVEDPDFISSLPLSQVECVISTIPDYRSNALLIDTLKDEQFQGKLVVTAHYTAQQEQLLERGSDWVLLPYRDAASQAVRDILKGSFSKP